MEKEKLLEELKRIIDAYVDDKKQRELLKTDVVPSKVKYVLAEIEEYRKKEFLDSDQKIIEDIYFNFC